ACGGLPDTGTYQIWVEVVMPGVVPIAKTARLSGDQARFRIPAQRAGPRVRSAPPPAGTSTGAPRYPALPGVLTPTAIDFPSGDHTGPAVVRIGGLVDCSLRESDPSARAVIRLVSVSVLSVPKYAMRCPS